MDSGLVLTLVSVGIVAAASLAVLAVSAANKWDVTSRSYARWVRVIGVVALVAFGATIAWPRREQLAFVVVVGAVTVALAALFVWAHSLLTRKVVSLRNDDVTTERAEQKSRL